MVVLDEVSQRDDNGVAEAAVVGSVLHLLREDVAAVDDAGDVDDADSAVDVLFADLDF